MNTDRNFGVRRNYPAVSIEQGLPSWGRAPFDKLPLEECCRTEDISRTIHVSDTRQLHKDLICSPALDGNDRLRNAELVDPPFHSLSCLSDCLNAETRKIVLERSRM